MNSKRTRAGRLFRIAAILVLLPLVVFVAYTLLVNIVALGLPAGQAAPDFSGRDLQGNVVRLSELRGRPVMLTFWSPECFACRDEVPSLQAIAQDPAQDVALVTVVSHMSAAEVQQYVYDHKLTFPVVVDEGGTIPGLYQVTGIPFSYFIRPDGTIERTVIGSGEPGALSTDLQRWLTTCKIDAPCAVKS